MKTLRILLILFAWHISGSVTLAQHFDAVPKELLHQGPFSFNSLLLTSMGKVLIVTSAGIYQADAQQIDMSCSNPTPTDDKGQPEFFGKNSNIITDLFGSLPGVKQLCEGPDSVVFVVTHNNNLGYIDFKKNGCITMPPINFQDGKHEKVVTAIWLDQLGTLFIGTKTGIVYYVENATKTSYFNELTRKLNFTMGLDKDSNYVVLSGALPVKQFNLGTGIIPYSFAKNGINNSELFVGTNEGLFVGDWRRDKMLKYLSSSGNSKYTITKIESDKLGMTFWLSTLEHGMAKFERQFKNLEFYPYPKKKQTSKTYPVTSFFRKSKNELFVSIPDSTPAIFNTESGIYSFIKDSSFSETENKTTDFIQDRLGMIYLIKGGGLFIAQSSVFGSNTSNLDSSLVGPFIKNILIDNQEYRSRYWYDGHIESLKEISVEHDENNLTIFYSSRGMLSDSLVFAWRIGDTSNNWIEKEYSAYGDYTNAVPISGLSPGRYTVRIKVKKIGSTWLKKEAVIVVNIRRPFWQTWWFWAAIVSSLSTLIYLIVRWRTSKVRAQERAKAAREKEILELEAKALRAQMNPHFIFNCLNSIKDLIQKSKNEDAINYLATFSKLIRTIFQNSDKREITLFDELENCRLYIELESLRFGSKLSYIFTVDKNIDLKSIMVPSLIIQPFIENAIWHGLMPKQAGGRLEVQVSATRDKIFCIIDDNGVGRESSWQHKTFATHDSRGVRLTQTRLELSNSINQRNATVEIIDKKNDLEQPQGTRVVLSFSVE